MEALIGEKRNPSTNMDDLESEFDYQSEAERKKKKRTDFLVKERPGEETKPGRSEAKHWFQEEHGREYRKMSRLMSLNAYSRHKEMINLYTLAYPGATALLKRDTSRDKTDYDVLRENHKFIWSTEDETIVPESWEARMAKKYYDKLFKEYCIVDLTYYRQNKIAMRWRIEKEVHSGKGQFICGNKKCNSSEHLTSWEVNFCYSEDGQKKNALVKVRLCPNCSSMLNYKTEKKKVVKKAKMTKKSSRKLDAMSEEKTVDIDVSLPGTSEDAKKESSDVWLKPAVVEAERTVDEDIDDFLDELFD